MASVDVAIPNYNYARYLCECVESVLAQNVEALRILIIDNASTDDSMAVARALAARDSRIAIVAHEMNLGPHASWNEAIDWAASDYFMVLCSDDLLAPSALARAISIMERNKEISFVHGQEITLRGDANRTAPDTGHEQEEWRIMSGDAFVAASCEVPANYINGGTMVIRTAAQKQAGHCRPELRYTDDLEMMLRLALTGAVAETNAVQGIRRLHGTNMSELYARERAAELRHRHAAFENFFAHEGRTLPNREDLRKRARKGLAERAYWWGVRDLGAGRVRAAIDLFRLAFQLRPGTVLLPPVGYLFSKRNPLNGFAPVRRPISSPFRRV